VRVDRQGVLNIWPLLPCWFPKDLQSREDMIAEVSLLARLRLGLRCGWSAARAAVFAQDTPATKVWFRKIELSDIRQRRTGGFRADQLAKET